jgi:hypothetical protein
VEAAIVNPSTIDLLYDFPSAYISYKVNATPLKRGYANMSTISNLVT